MPQPLAFYERMCCNECTLYEVITVLAVAEPTPRDLWLAEVGDHLEKLVFDLVAVLDELNGSGVCVA